MGLLQLLSFHKMVIRTHIQKYRGRTNLIYDQRRERDQVDYFREKKLSVL